MVLDTLPLSISLLEGGGLGVVHSFIHGFLISLVKIFPSFFFFFDLLLDFHVELALENLYRLRVVLVVTMMNQSRADIRGQENIIPITIWLMS